MAKENLIYALCCPFTDSVHYIGKTTIGMRRPMQHVSKSHSKKIRDWVNSIKELGYKPIIKILEVVESESDLNDKEKYWIQFYLNKKEILLNEKSVTPILVHPNLDLIIGNDDTEDIHMMRISRFIKDKRKKYKITQEELSQKIGMSLKVIRKIEQKQTNFQIDGLFKILKAFGCTIEIVKKYNE